MWNVDSTTNVSNDIWQGRWNTQNSEWIENENYFITFKAVDLVGNSYIAAPVIVKLDNQDDESPIGYIKNPITGQTVDGLVSIEVEATDNKAIQYVSIFINNEIKITHLSEPFNYNWNTELEPDDLVCSIYAVIVDVDNNRTTIPPISVTVNKFTEHNEEIYEAWKSCWQELEGSEHAASDMKYIWSYQINDGEVYYIGINIWPSKETRAAFVESGGPEKFLVELTKLFEEKTGMTIDEANENREMNLELPGMDIQISNL